VNVANLLDEGLACGRDVFCRGRHGEAGRWVRLCRYLLIKYPHFI